MAKKKNKRWWGRAERVKGSAPYRMQGGGVRRMTLHTSESDPGSLQGVSNWIVQKGIEYHFVIDDKLEEAHQFFPCDMGAKSMRYWDDKGDIHIQVCVVGRAHNDPVKDLSPWAKDFIEDICDSWDIPRVVVKSKDMDVWESTSGIFRHMDAPFNASSDPGRVPAGFFKEEKKVEPPKKKKKKVSRILRKGNKGKAVKLLQRRLNIPADGVFGKATKKAVKKAQKAHKLEADGIVGPATWDALGVRYKAPKWKVTKDTNTRWPTSKTLMKKIQAVAKDTGTHLHIRSGYRSNAEQAVLYQRYLNGQGPLAARPGSSNHNRGTAADMGIIDKKMNRYRSIGYAPKKVLKAMRKHGLALVIPSEAWHVEVSNNWRWGR